MNTLIIVAKIKTKTDKTELVKKELLKLIEPTRKEEGCIQYDLHQDNTDPAVFLFYEQWATRELWQKHMNNPNLAEYMQATDGAVEEFIIHEMTTIA